MNLEMLHGPDISENMRVVEAYVQKRIVYEN